MKQTGLPGYQDKDDDTQRKELQKLMRRVFSTEEGKVAFNVILTDLGFFNVTHTTEEAALRNYAALLITERMGIVDTVDISNHMLQTDSED